MSRARESVLLHYGKGSYSKVQSSHIQSLSSKGDSRRSLSGMSNQRIKSAIIENEINMLAIAEDRQNNFLLQEKGQSIMIQLDECASVDYTDAINSLW